VEPDRKVGSVYLRHPSRGVVVLLHRFENVGEARQCYSLEHLFYLQRKSHCRYILDEAQKEKMLEPFAP